MKAITTLSLVLACTVGFLVKPASTAPDHPVAGVRGVIMAFDHDRGGIVLFNARVGRLAVKVDDDFTRVLINDNPARLSDLRTGMKVVVMGPFSPVTRHMRGRSIRVRQ